MEIGGGWVKQSFGIILTDPVQMMKTYCGRFYTAKSALNELVPELAQNNHKSRKKGF